MLRTPAVSVLVTLSLCACVSRDSLDPALYEHPIPPSIMTPDRVETQVGTLEFVDGRPTADTAQALYDQLDFQRGVKVFLDSIPACSLEAMRRGMESYGARGSNDAVLMKSLLDSTPLFLTGNTDTVYCSVILDLKRDGPTVVEIPPKCGPGTVNDAFFRFVVDMGAPGPDRGSGGKYLILPPGFDGDVPDGYFVGRSRSWINWLILRGFLVDGKPDASVAMFEEGLRVYPLAQAQQPPEMNFIDGSKKPVNTIHANDVGFFDELAEVIEREPVDLIDPELRGLIASIGIRKGEPFAPDARMRRILDQAAKVGNGTARALAFAPRDDAVWVYPGRYWQTAFVGGDYRWLVGDGAGGRNLDARTVFFYIATVNTPAMAMKMVGKGSQYALCCRDSGGAFLDGSHHYRLRVPADVPAADFWSVVVYDPQTRSELQTGQPFPSKNNEKDELVTNADGSVDLWFGPTAPAGKETNWIQTVAGKGWFAILRLYGPLEPWFEKTWQPGDFERVD